MVIVDDVACMAEGCPHRGVKGAGNVALRRTYGPDDIRFLWCRTCKTQFSERRGTPLFDLRLPKAKIVDVEKHLAEGVGVRKTARLTGVSRGSVGHILKLVGGHAKAIHDDLVQNLDVPEVQMDEMWSFVGKKDKHLTEEERASGELGSIWDNVAVDPATKVMVSLVQGPSRDQETCDKLVDDFADRTGHEPPNLVTTDEHAPYKNSLLKTYGKDHRPRRRAKRGRKRKVKKRSPKGMTYATVKKTRKKGRVVHVRRELVLGTEENLVAALDASPCSATINTSFVERNNGTSRHFNSRKQRDTYCFSKQLAEHEAMSWLMLTHYNFCWKHRMLRLSLGDKRYAQRSPAVAAGIADHVWTVEEFLARQVVT